MMSSTLQEKGDVITKVTMLDVQGLLDAGFRDRTAKNAIPTSAKDKSGEAGTVLVIPAGEAADRKTPVAAYCRVSTLLESQEGSVSSQKAHYEELIRGNSAWEFAGVYLEAGVSGTHAETRPQLQRLLTDCRAGRVQMILTKSISRFARNTTDCLSIIRELSSLGVSVRFEKEGIDTAALGTELLLSVLSCLAEDESRSISANVRWGIQKRFAAGTYRMAVAPFGFRKTNNGLEADPKAAEIVRGIFQSFLMGNGLRKIAGSLNALGLPSPRGGSWTDRTIRHILPNPVYVGDLLLQKTFRGEDFRQRKNRGELDQYLDEGHHEPIVERSVFEAAARELREGAGIGGSPTEETDPGRAAKRQTRYALSGKVRCGSCGRTMYRETGNGRPVYVCACKGRGHRVAEAEIQAAFITVLNKLSFGGEELLDSLAEEEKNDRTADIEARMKENQRRIDVLNAAALADSCREEAWTDKAGLLREKEALRKELSRALAAPEGLARLRSIVRDWKPSREIGDFPEAGFVEVVKCVTTLPDGRVTFTFTCGLVLAEGVLKKEAA